MKYILLLTTAFSLSGNVFSQIMKSSIGLGSAPNKVILYIKPDLAVNGTISTLSFAVALPAATPAGTVCLVTSTILAGFTWTISPTSHVEGAYRIWDIASASSPIVSIGAGVETAVMELSFGGGTSAAFVSSITLPDGGPGDANAIFYCSGAADSDGSNLYYTRPGPPATTVINGFSYPGGTDISTASFGPISLVGSLATDYYRSITSGNWNSPATWESSPVANFSSGLISPATLSPDFNANDINIRAGHTVTVTANVTTDQTFVNAGATLVATGSTLTINGTGGLTVQSSSASTGRIGNSTGTITGSVNVERYINSDVVGRKWHLLSGIATTTAQTIRASWQEGGGAPATPNIGTWLTAPGTPAGYDGSSIGYSILTHDPTGPSWVNLAATNAGSINAQRGYMLFVRGDRFAQPPPNVLQAPTVLRTTGSLNQGTQPAVTVINASPGYTIMGNPFASPIDLENVLTTANLGQFFYVWDASIAGNFGVGKFRLVQKTGPGTYTATPSTGSDNTTRYIHSGQGFFLKASGADASVVLNESHKTNLLSVVNPIVNTAGNQQIYTELSIADQGSKEYVTDAVRVWFNASYSAGIKDDILKMGNFSDNLSSYRDGKKWIVENRPMIVSNDTIFLRMSGISTHNYRLRINTIDFVQTNVTAFLQDNWLNTNTPISIDGSVTNVDFSVTADPASANQDRFRIVFGVKKTDIPVVVVAGAKGVVIYPNPVSGRMVNIKFTDMEKGIYQLRLISTGGQLVMLQQVNHGGGSTILRMGLDKMIANGNYQLEIIKPDNSRIMKSLIIVN